MRPVQQLYFEHGELYCPVHGHRFIRLMVGDSAQQRIYWCCNALLPDGTHCLHMAGWESLEAIDDVEVRMLTASMESR